MSNKKAKGKLCFDSEKNQLSFECASLGISGVPVQPKILSEVLKQISAEFLHELEVEVEMHGDAIAAIIGTPEQLRFHAWRALKLTECDSSYEVTLFEPLGEPAISVTPWRNGRLKGWNPQKSTKWTPEGSIQEIRLRGTIIDEEGKEYKIRSNCRSLVPLWTDSNLGDKFRSILPLLKDGTPCEFKPADNDEVEAIRNIPSVDLATEPEVVTAPPIPLALNIPASATTTEPQPDAFHNPYAFIAPVPRNDADLVWGRHSPPSHDRFHSDHLTGVITIHLTAQSPYFSAVTHKLLEDGRIIMKPRSDIATTSLKGSVRSMYEALTNSCFSRFDDDRHRVSYRITDRPQAGRPSDLAAVRIVRKGGKLIAEAMQEARVLAYAGDECRAANSPYFPSARFNVSSLCDGQDIWFRFAQLDHVAVTNKKNITSLRSHPENVEAFFVGERPSPQQIEKRVPDGAEILEGAFESLSNAEVLGGLTLPRGTLGVRAQNGEFYPFRRDVQGQIWPTVARSVAAGTRVWFATTKRIIVIDIVAFEENENPPIGYHLGFLRKAGRAERTNKAFESVFFPYATPRELELPDSVRKDFEALVDEAQHLQRNREDSLGSPFLSDPNYRRVREGMLLYAETSDSTVMKLYAVKMGRGLYKTSFRQALARYTPYPGIVDDDELDGPFNWPGSLLPCRHVRHLCPACRLFGWIEPKGSASVDAYGRRAHSAIRGRIRFSAAKLQGLTSAWVENLAGKEYGNGIGLPLAVLSSPKPNRRPFYLRSEEPNGPDWDADSSMPAGRKAYWNQPKDPAFWETTANSNTLTHPFRRKDDVWDKQNAVITGWVKPGARFHTDIRFDNLSPEELGALLACLELPEGCTIGLGMAKPFGFGRFRSRVAGIQIIDVTATYGSFGPPVLRPPNAGMIREWVSGFAASLYAAYRPLPPATTGDSPARIEAKLSDLPFVRDLVRILAGPESPASVHYPRVSKDVPNPGPQIEWSKRHKSTLLPRPCSGATLRRDDA